MASETPLSINACLICSLSFLFFLPLRRLFTVSPVAFPVSFKVPCTSFISPLSFFNALTSSSILLAAKPEAFPIAWKRVTTPPSAAPAAIPQGPNGAPAAIPVVTF